ncbi:unnamed protein product [Clonostachys rosea]|uniref:AB hydrolase-1 domain-containing protein n=1 Tax=Bionectria ochroleuca TaxID=29856 RepID=A0ABY6UES2_BIOOC|nr:unnamed protein product [Clonostachys rosea]
MSLCDGSFYNDYDEVLASEQTYVRTSDHCCMPPGLQELRLEDTGVKWNVVHLKVGHMPFINMPKELAEQRINSAEGSMKL